MVGEMSETTIGEFVSTAVIEDVVLGSVATTVIGSYLAEGNLGAEGVLQNLLPLGGPTAMGILAAHYVLPAASNSSDMDMAYRGVIAGAVTVALLVGTGAIPWVLDSQTMVLVGTVTAGSMIGEYIQPMLPK